MLPRLSPWMKSSPFALSGWTLRMDGALSATDSVGAASEHRSTAIENGRACKGDLRTGTRARVPHANHRGERLAPVVAPPEVAGDLAALELRARVGARAHGVEGSPP